jgi:hypothetical protein
MKEKYIEECKQIQQNCTYTAEAHHRIARWNKGLSYVFQIIPAVIAAITSALVAASIKPPSWLWATVVASIISAVATIVDPNKKYQEHLSTAKSFTTLKHDARFLHEAKAQTMTDEAFCVAVESLHDKYNELVKMAPPTGSISFAIARKVVGSGIHEPDTDPSGKIK